MTLDHLHKSLPPWLEASCAVGARVLHGDLLFPVAVLREAAISANRTWMKAFLALLGFVVYYKYLGHQCIALSLSLNAVKSTGFVRKSSAPSRLAVL